MLCVNKVPPIVISFINPLKKMLRELIQESVCVCVCLMLKCKCKSNRMYS